MFIYFCCIFLTYFLQYLVAQSKIYDKQMYIHSQISRGFESRWRPKLEKSRTRIWIFWRQIWIPELTRIIKHMDTVGVQKTLSETFSCALCTGVKQKLPNLFGVREVFHFFSFKKIQYWRGAENCSLLWVFLEFALHSGKSNWSEFCFCSKNSEAKSPPLQIVFCTNSDYKSHGLGKTKCTKLSGFYNQLS